MSHSIKIECSVSCIRLRVGEEIKVEFSATSNFSLGMLRCRVSPEEMLEEVRVAAGGNWKHETDPSATHQTNQVFRLKARVLGKATFYVWGDAPSGPIGMLKIEIEVIAPDEV